VATSAVSRIGFYSQPGIPRADHYQPRLEDTAQPSLTTDRHFGWSVNIACCTGFCTSSWGSSLYPCCSSSPLAKAGPVTLACILADVV